MNRKELRDEIIASSKFKSLVESVPELTDVIEHFLNGRYVEFTKCMDTI